MLKPARANSWTVASCSEPFGMPSLSFMVLPPIQHKGHEGHQEKYPTISTFVAIASFVLIQRSKTRPCTGVAHVAVAQPLYFHQHGVVVAIDEDLDDLEFVAG